MNIKSNKEQRRKFKDSCDCQNKNQTQKVAKSQLPKQLMLKKRKEKKKGKKNSWICKVKRSKKD